MTEISDQPDSTSDAKPRSATRGVAKGYRILHMQIPERIFHHAKAQSHLSCLRFPDYMARLLERAQPFTIDPGPIFQTDPDAVSSGNVAAIVTTAPSSGPGEETDGLTRPDLSPQPRNREVDS